MDSNKDHKQWKGIKNAFLMLERALPIKGNHKEVTDEDMEGTTDLTHSVTVNQIACSA